jgi:lysophospholipase L1-like esterase
VILDWGTNDIIYRNALAPNLERTVVATIRKVRAVHPNALIMLTSAQDMYFRLKPITAAWDFAVLMRRLAAENNCLFYDWYRVAGGRDSMLVWYAYELAGADHVHLSSHGYAIKGDLMGQALLNTIKALDANSRLDRIAVQPMREENGASVSAWLKSAKPSRPRPPLVGASRTTVVRPPQSKPKR